MKKQSPKVLKIQQAVEELKDLRKNRLTIQTNHQFLPQPNFPSSSPQKRYLGLGPKEMDDLYCMSSEKNSVTRQNVRNLKIQKLTNQNASFEKLDDSSDFRNLVSMEENSVTDRFQPRDPFDKLILVKD